VYDPATHRYARFNGGKSHHDLKPANVLVQFVGMEVLDDVGRLRLQTNGTGKAIVFRDGQAIEGTWDKDPSFNTENPQAPQIITRFLDKNGKEIPLNRGQTWIEVVPNGRTVNYF
jgi:serine/threonine protein kinase